MLKRSLALIFVLLCALLFGACGSSASPKATTGTTLPPKHIDGHECTPLDEALQCVLPPAPRSLFGAPRALLHGVDFAWGAPSAARMHSLGAKFGASYFSFDPGKGWRQRAGLVSEYHRAGIATVGVWETTARRAAQGCRAGYGDAAAASSQARAVGNTDRPIDFAIDFDATGPQVASYFRCAHEVLGDRASAYGGYRPLQYLCAHHLVGHTNWQTYAWSNGAWLPASCAPLEQYLNGSSVDYDRAIAPDFGQWPAPVKRPTKAELHKRKVKTLRRLSTERRELHGDVDRHHCRGGKPWFGHAKPRRYHSLCVRWVRRGKTIAPAIKRLEGEL